MNVQQQRYWQESQFLPDLINLLPYFVFWKDTDSIFLGCNERFAHMAGLSFAKEIIGKTDYDLPWERAQSDAYRADDKHVMETRSPKINIEEQQTLSNGEKIVLLTSKVPLIDSEDTVVGVLVTYIDITHLKRKEEELEKAKLMAEEANFLKTQFIQNISHELRTPLNGMLGIAEVLSYSSMLNAEDKEKIASLQSSGQVLLKLVNHILNYSKIESRQIPLEFSEVNFSALVKEVVASFLPAAQQKNLALTYYYADTCPSHLVMDATCVRQVLVNFIDNAIKFTHQGSVTVFIDGVATEANKILLQMTVKDTGVGISEKQLENIFERFYQVNPSYTQTCSGVGLGLAIVKELVTAMEGEIKVESRLGEGSTFSVSLPCRVNRVECVPDRKISTVEKLLDLKQHKSPLRILLVEDSAINQKVMNYMLSLLLDCTITIAGTGVEAISLFNRDIDLVLLDIGLPDISGFDVAEALNKKMAAENFSVPLVSITAHADVNEGHPLYQQLKFSGSLIKPVQIQTLKELLHKVLDKS